MKGLRPRRLAYVHIADTSESSPDYEGIKTVDQGHRHMRVWRLKVALIMKGLRRTSPAVGCFLVVSESSPDYEGIKTDKE